MPRAPSSQHPGPPVPKPRTTNSQHPGLNTQDPQIQSPGPSFSKPRSHSSQLPGPPVFKVQNCWSSKTRTAIFKAQGPRFSTPRTSGCQSPGPPVLQAQDPSSQRPGPPAFYRQAPLLFCLCLLSTPCPLFHPFLPHPLQLPFAFFELCLPLVTVLDAHSGPCSSHQHQAQGVSELGALTTPPATSAMGAVPVLWVWTSDTTPERGLLGDRGTHLVGAPPSPTPQEPSA